MREPVGLILAGGTGVRMGGAIKANISLGGRRLLDHVVDRIEPQVASLAISANAPVETTLPCLPDESDDRQGPLAGILAGLIWAETMGASHMVSVAVDSPFLPCDLVPQLLLAAGGDVAIAATSDGLHGTFGLWPVGVRNDLAEFLDRGGRKVRAFTQEMGAATARFPDSTPPAFFNINTPADLETAAQWM